MRRGAECVGRYRRSGPGQMLEIRPVVILQDDIKGEAT